MGHIERISGPLVVANEMLGSKMYDVVKVGDLGLIGEIIQLRKEKAVIQVYEDTTGLKPGEKVESTGVPLSVELAPGLLQNIYDGIQRPLEVLRSKSGAFIGKGISANAIDRNKKWKFIIEKGVKNGSSVHEGDIIGYVQETDLIKHYIMIPSGVEGKIIGLKEGTFEVDDKIATVEKGNKKTAVTMLQRRSVRKPQAFRRKFRSDEPLTTGMRVIDGLFPVAKGGTAAIPGPFGAGKCVTGDTPILLSDGRLISMQDLYDSACADSSSNIRKGENEEIIETTTIGLFSLDKNKVVKSTSNIIYHGKSDSIIKVRTRTGRVTRVTPIHKLFRINEHGEIVETMAKDLKVGEFIAASRKVNVTNQDSVLKLPDAVRAIGTNGKRIKLPDKITPELAEFLGYFVSEGYVRGAGTIVFTNLEETLLDRFLELGRNLFGLEGKKEYQPGKTPNVLLGSRMLVRFMRFLGVGEIARTKEIPQCILASSNDTLRAFLTSYFIGDGSYYDGEVELCTASKKLQTQLAYCFARFGVMTTLKDKVVNGEHYYRIFVRGRTNLSTFVSVLFSVHKKISAVKAYVDLNKAEYNSIDIVPISKEYLREVYYKYGSYSQLLKVGIEIHNYIGNGERMGVGTFKKFVEHINVRSGNQMQKLALHELAEALEWIYCDEIVALEEEIGPIEVYDFSVPEFGSNFVGGYGGLILHNTVSLHSIAKFADSDIVVMIGCGERGNEMTEVLVEFPELKDPKTGKPLMERTVLIANTSNMPVAAREASIYTGVTIAEYFRDMGYSVTLLADSTSRWAEAMREISARLEEMPGEEGYPAYLPKRLAEYYERGGKIEALSGKIGSITIVGAVSPPGGDLSEPVSQGTLRVVKTFWSLDASLANSRHFPSINWLTSYSLYHNDLRDWYVKNLGEGFVDNRAEVMRILQKEAELKDIVQLVGAEALPDSERVVLEIGRMVREDFLRQSAFDEVDAYTSLKKQAFMIASILHFRKRADDAVKNGVNLDSILKLKVREDISRMKEVKESDVDKAKQKIASEIDSQFNALLKEYKEIEV